MKHTLRILLLALPVLCACYGLTHGPQPGGVYERYRNAIADARTIEPSEICTSLVPIQESNGTLSWTVESGEKHVLMVTWTSWEGFDKQVRQSVALQRDVWVTAVPELRDFCREHSGITDLTLRIEQVLGLPPRCGKDRFVELWVLPEDIFRPSADPEIDDSTAGSEFPPEVDRDHQEWIDQLMETSYTPDGYPWTRLGYTYDWGDEDDEIGLSEYVIRAGAEVIVSSISGLYEYCECAK